MDILHDALGFAAKGFVVFATIARSYWANAVEPTVHPST